MPEFHQVATYAVLSVHPHAEDPMNAAHLHLLLNHIPVLGAIGLTLLFLIAAVRRDSPLARLTLVFSVVLAATSLAVFLTGEPAEEVVEDIAGVATNAIEEHEEAALAATIAFGILGLLAVVPLAAFRRRELPRWVMVGGLIGAVSVAGLMGWTANLGGQIRHTEISAPGGLGVDEDDEPPGG